MDQKLIQAVTNLMGVFMNEEDGVELEEGLCYRDDMFCSSGPCSCLEALAQEVVILVRAWKDK